MLPIAIPARQCRASSYSSAGASSAFRHGARYKQQTCTCKASNRCHYEVLGVDNSASANDIKQAFRKLALKLHPDVNTAPDAAAAFTAAKSAYEVLSDPQQRAAYNNSLKQNHVHSRSSTRSWQSGTSSSSGRRRRAQSRGTYSEYVIYDFSNFGDEVEEEEIAEAAGAGFHGWYAESGSWQSSWEANKKKQQKRHKQQQQQQQAQWRQEQQWQALTELLQQQDPQTLGVVAHVFGEGLEDLNSIEELLDLLAGLELLKEEGIEPDVSMFETRADRHNRSTRRRRSSNGAHESNPDSQSSRHHSKQANAADASSSRRSRGAGSSAGHGTSSRQQQEATAAGRRGRQKTTSSSKQQGNTSRSSKAGKMPRFEELSFEELLTVMQDQRQPMVAQAAREWASSYNFADPRLAADVEAFLTLEYLSGDWDDGSIAASLNSNSSSSMWQHVSFDYDEYAERQKCKAKPGSARDYVRYQVEDEDDLADVRQYIKDEFGCMEIDDIYLGSNWEGDDCDDVVYVRF